MKSKIENQTSHRFKLSNNKVAYVKFTVSQTNGKYLNTVVKINTSSHCLMWNLCASICAFSSSLIKTVFHPCMIWFNP